MIRRATLLAMLVLALAAPAAQADFGFVPGSMTVDSLEEDGNNDFRAGSHPYAFTIHVELKTLESRSEGGEMRDLIFDLPPGLVGNPRALPQCSIQDFEGADAPHCPPSTQVGVVRAVVPGIGQLSPPLFNVEPGPAQAAQLGFSAQGFIGMPSATLRSDEGLPNEAEERYGIRVATTNLPIEATAVTATIWGNPPDKTHDPERANIAKGKDGGESSQAPPLAFFTLPTSCHAKPVITAYANSKLNPGVYATESAPIRSEAGLPASLIGCDAVPFAPTALAGYSSSAAESPSGLDFHLELPNKGLLAPDGVAETQPVKTVVTLPQGVTANPSAADGLSSCSEAQFAAATVNDPGCPAASKLGTLFASTPLLEEPIEGSVYLATPQANRFGSLFALYIVAAAPERGVLIKQAGRVDVDPSTGQLTTTFDGLPPVPYSSFEVRLREGPRAPLTTPQTCGTYTTTARLYPYSDPDTATVRSVPFKVTSGAGGSACASSEAELPANPAFSAGTTAPIAGAYSPFVFRVSRNDGEQRFSSIAATLPTGLLGKLKGVPYCPESGTATAESRTQEGGGALELAQPSCPAASQVGVVNVAAGSGPSPYYVQGKAYLAGPYKGAPLSLEIITPAVAGPFDLGSVAVRTALSIGLFDAQIHAQSDPLPTILHGIPLDVRTISLQMDRNEFTLNPTNCSSKTVAGGLTTLTGQSASLSAPFAVGGCKGLEFKPKLQISLKGATKRTGHPALKAVVTYPKGSGQANIARAQVELPPSEFLDQGHIGTVCTQPQLKTQTCPAASIYGKATAYSPLLDKPLSGPVYLGAGFGHTLPDLVADLNGQIRVLVHGRVDTGKKGGIRNTFEAVPDAPVSKFVLEMKGGKKGLLVNSVDICKGTHKALVKFSGQNGKVSAFKAPVKNSCGGRGKK